jgi:hypothetical protein
LMKAPRSCGPHGTRSATGIFVKPEGGAGIGSPVRGSVTFGYALPAALITVVSSAARCLRHQPWQC